MHVLIFGLGLLGGGFAAASYFLDQGAEVRITDLRSEAVLGGPLAILVQRGATAICQEHRQEDFLWADVVIKNPAISTNNPLLGFARKIETDISYLFSSPIIKNIAIIAITGTKGKTTTAAAVAHVLNSNGKEALQCGNMGISGFSILSELQNREKNNTPYPDYLICELSSWQIRDTYAAMGEHLPEFRMIVLTSLFADHMNSYNDFSSYKQDKWLLFTSKSKQVIVAANEAADVRNSTGIPSKKIFAIEDVPGSSKIEARLRPAWAVCRKLGFLPKQILTSLESFRGVPHRQEQVAIANNIIFINDSSATIPEAVSFSCGSCPYPYVLICGGTDKNLAAEPMLPSLRSASSIHVLDGSFSRNKLIPLLAKESISFNGLFFSMREAVDSAYNSALGFTASSGGRPMIAIMLSPGAASFGLFKHEFDRGDQFREIAKEIASIAAHTL